MILIKILIGLIIGGGILGYGTYWAISNERKSFNNGMCTKCNIKLRNFDTTSQGNRLYICDKCGRDVFVSYDCVDKLYKEGGIDERNI